ncbi:MAG: 6-hydroxymethylpterin diphosphokinase MptE-like protein [Desulfovibrionaceae bacterium]
MKLGESRYDTLARDQWNGETVFALGSVEVDPAIPRDHVVSVPKPGFVHPAKLCAGLPEETWERTVFFLTPSRTDAKQAQAVLRIQKHALARMYLTFFNRRPLRDVPKTLSAIMGGIKDPSRNISQLRNYPWLLRYPLVDKLASARLGLPALLLLAGPSLNRILPRLPELAQRCLVICIARSLKPCLDAGVEPDFVVQYDTNMEQRQFYAGVPQLPNTGLVTLSSAHIHPYAELFRGVFFRGSFNRAFMPNPYTLRDGVEGSLIACLGLAEALGAPQTYLAGADLSWPMDGNCYTAGEEPATDAPDAAQDVRVHTLDGMKVRLGRRDGKIVFSTACFVASAVKAGQTAAEIASSGNAAFHTLSEATLLPEDVFPLTAIEDVLGLPAVDRAEVRAKMDLALNAREHIELMGLFAFLKDREQGLSGYRDMFTLRSLEQEARKKLPNDPMVRILGNMRGACWYHKLNDPLVSANRLMAAWKQAFAEAAKFVLAHVMAAKGAPLTLLCAPEEEAELRSRLARLIPGCVLDLRQPVRLGHDRGEGGFDDYDLPLLLDDAHLLLVSPRLMRCYAHFWELAPDDKVVDLGQLGPDA